MKLMMFFLLSVFFFLFGNFIYAAPAAASYPDVKIIKSTDQSLVLEFNMQDFRLLDEGDSEKKYMRPSFAGARYNPRPGEPMLPYRVIKIGIPQNGKPAARVISKEVRSMNVSLLPGPVPARDESGLYTYKNEADEAVYQSNMNFPRDIISVSEPVYFRDQRMIELKITPMQYNPASALLNVYNKIRVQINFNAKSISRSPFRKMGKLDDLYEEMLINFDQAKNWQQKPARTIAKTADNPQGTWYRYTVQEDGLYKITPSALSSSSINIDNLSIDRLQMFNNGGHMLNIKVNASDYNPPYTQEIPVFIHDADQNGFFDGSDFLLFYGKAVNGWFYDYSKKQFAFHQHAFASENYYWLTVSGSNGLRISEELLTDQPGAAAVDFYYDYYHFEEDLYNLLSSGPDWYGRRFFGLSDSYSKTFELAAADFPGARAEFRIKLKGGSNIRYSETGTYRYTFDVYLNDNQLINNYSFTNASSVTREVIISDLSLLRNGQNTVTIQYAGDVEACTANLDWFELNYPRAFTAENNSFKFYTANYSQPLQYTISGFAGSADVYVFDVTDPVNPLLLAENLQAASGTVSFDLGVSDGPREILVSSLASSEINNVSRLTAVQRTQDLIAASNQADYIIITPESFLPYARQLADLRTELTTKVVTVKEVYFEFNSGVPDPTAIRNFVKHAYYNWQKDAPSYLCLFGDAHYDYRNIALKDSLRVPTWEIFSTREESSRATDGYFVDVGYNGSSSFGTISPDLAVGRVPNESVIDAERFLEKITRYEDNPVYDGWQTVLTWVGDDNIKPFDSGEWYHQNDLDEITRFPELAGFNMKKIYLSTYPSKPGGFGRVKPEANNDIIDALNQGTLIINYVGHGSPTKWAHEDVFLMERDLDRINNAGKLPFLIAATCDFGKFDNPHDVSFTEALIWKKQSGIIGALATSRLVYGNLNAAFNKAFIKRLFPNGAPSRRVGDAMALSQNNGVNDQKFILFADPAMRLADPREKVVITTITPDTLKALSEVSVEGEVHVQNQFAAGFNGEAFLIVNDARYDSVKTGSGFDLVTLPGPLIFKGEVSVEQGRLNGKFIVPKSIRYKKRNTGRITIFAYNEESGITASGYNNSLLFTGAAANASDTEGPEIDVYFEQNENFSRGDMVSESPVLLADVSDENGVNITGQAGHKILLQVDDEDPRDISGYFAYEKNSFRSGKIRYPLDQVKSGRHSLEITAFDNLNNLSKEDTEFNIASGTDIVLDQVVNYPNPFKGSTVFTFQTNRSGADALVKIYTMTGRLIQQLEGLTVSGYNDEISWDGRDRDGDEIANGVYLYKIVLRDGKEKTEKIEKLVIMK